MSLVEELKEVLDGIAIEVEDQGKSGVLNYGVSHKKIIDASEKNFQAAFAIVKNSAKIIETQLQETTIDEAEINTAFQENFIVFFICFHLPIVEVMLYVM